MLSSSDCEDVEVGLIPKTENAQQSECDIVNSDTSKQILVSKLPSETSIPKAKRQLPSLNVSGGQTSDATVKSDLPKVSVTRPTNIRRSSSLKLPNGVRQRTDSDSSKKDEENVQIDIIEEHYPLVSKPKFSAGSTGLPLFGDGYIDDYITPEMNYKGSRTGTNMNANDQTWDKEDNISLYGTPKEEMMPGLGDTKGPSFMRSQIEALFQPSGTLVTFVHFKL